MKSFKVFLKEDDYIDHQLKASGKDSSGLENPLVLDQVNDAIARATAQNFITPYIALGAIAKVLAYANIILPQHVFLDMEGGETAFELENFAHVQGQNVDGSLASPNTDPLYLYFDYEPDGNGRYSVFAELVDDAGLDDLMDDDGDEYEDSGIVIPEEKIEEISKEKLEKYQKNAHADYMHTQDPKREKKRFAGLDQAFDKLNPKYAHSVKVPATNKD